MSNTSHRLDNNEDFVGEDQSDFPTGVNHIQPHRVPPGPQVIQHVPGPFIPFVGQGASVFHGVAPTEGSYHNDPYEAAEYQATLAPDYQAVPELVNPIPVIIVPPDAGPETFNDWRTVNDWIPVGDVLEVIGKDMHRSRMLVRNENTAATDTIRIASRRGEAVSAGYLVPAGVEMEINAQSALYATATTNPVRLSVLCEFSVNG